jgi:hypothetical protein
MAGGPRKWPGVGTGPYPLDKSACVDGWLTMLIAMSAGTLERYRAWPRQYTVIDLNAGPGRYLLADGQPVDGTPLLILRRLAASRLERWRAAFVEQDGAMARELRQWLAREAASLGIDAGCYAVLTRTSRACRRARSRMPRRSGRGGEIAGRGAAEARGRAR